MVNLKINYVHRRTHTGVKTFLNYAFSEKEVFIMFLSAGKCKLTSENLSKILSAGDVFINSTKFSRCSILPSRDAVFYCISATFHEGQGLEDFSLSDGIFCVNDIKSAKVAFAKIIKEHTLKLPLSSIALPCLYTELLCTLSRSMSNLSKAQSEAIALAEEINRNFTADIDVSAYSKRVGLSKDRFSVIFKELFGYAPYKYQLMLKMREAEYLLTHTDLPISKISELLGFSNQLYFSSAYRSQMGCAPTQTRKSKE